MKTNDYFLFTSSDIFSENRDSFNKCIIRDFKENLLNKIIYIYIYRYDFNSNPVIKQIYFTNEKSFFFFIRISKNKTYLINKFYNYFVHFIYNEIFYIKKLKSFNVIITSEFIKKILISDNKAYMDIFNNIDKINKSLDIDNLIKNDYTENDDKYEEFSNIIIKFDYKSIKNLIIENNPEIDKIIFDEVEYLLTETVIWKLHK